MRIADKWKLIDVCDGLFVGGNAELVSLYTCGSRSTLALLSVFIFFPNMLYYLGKKYIYTFYQGYLRF